MLKGEESARGSIDPGALCAGWNFSERVSFSSAARAKKKGRRAERRKEAGSARGPINGPVVAEIEKSIGRLPGVDRRRAAL